jgi:hypothetical protein
MKSFKIYSFLLGCSFTLFLWLIVDSNQTTNVEIQPNDEERFELITENIIDEEIQGEENIFFIESHLHVFHELDSHQACSIESAGKKQELHCYGEFYKKTFHFLARAYPNRKIFVMFLTKSKAKHVRLKSSLLLESIRNYENVNFKFVDIIEFSKKTPLENWILSDKLGKSKFPVSHTSDVLRFLTLFHYSGLYLDLDVIVTKNLSLTNFACVEDDAIVNSAILNLDKKRGKEIAEACLK